MYIEIMDNTIEPETKIRMSVSQWVTTTISIIGITATVLMYFGVIPVRGSNSGTELKVLSQDFATKEYVSVNFVTRDKLLDTVANIQSQIASVQLQQTEYYKSLDKRQERIEGLLLELIRLR